MTVDRTQMGCQTRYTMDDRAGLPVTLTLGAADGAASEWQIRLPATGKSSHPDVMHRFTAPVTVRLRAWLVPIIGTARAAELSAAVGAQPPRQRGWQPRALAAPNLRIPRQRDHRAA
jgi:hypothetical protein